jgi:hypothetical protein
MGAGFATCNLPVMVKFNRYTWAEKDGSFLEKLLLILNWFMQ